MKPQRIILLRHAESEGNANKEIYSSTPTHALDITEKGVEQAKQASTKLFDLIGFGSTRVYLSPYKRTRRTFEVIQSCTPYTFDKIYEEPRIREQDHGHFRDEEVMKKTEKERDAFGMFFYRFPDGESGADCYDRISSFLESLHRSFIGNYSQNYLIVTHGLTMRLFLMRWFHESVETYESWANPKNCGMFVLEWDTLAGMYLKPKNIELWKEKA